ncbi:MAG: EAL domain-containing protein [bacterium]|nr:EAL domain-containing protein [bacterium]
MHLTKRNFLLFAALTFLGFLGNLANVEMFFGVNQVFGSMFVLLIAWLFGPRWAFASALLAHGYTIYLWGHPYAYISFVAEAIAVGFMTRRGLHLLYADALYWIFGILLVPIFYGSVMGLSNAQVTLIALKQPANGLFNALGAALLASTPWLWNRLGIQSPKHKISELLTTLVMSFVVSSLYILANISTAASFKENQEKVSTEVIRSNAHLDNEFNAFHENNRSQAFLHLERYQREGKVTLLADYIPETAIYWANTGELPKLIAQKAGYAQPELPSLAKTHSSIHLLQMDRPTIQLHYNYQGSELFLLLPIEALNHLLRRQQSVYSNHAVIYLIYQDKVWASSDELAIGKPVDSLLSGERHNTPSGAFHLLPTTADLPKMLRWKESKFAHSFQPSGEDWYLLSIQSFGPHIDELQQLYIQTFALMLLIFLLSLLIIHQISRSVGSAFGFVYEATSNLPGRLLANQTPQWPASSIYELDQLTSNFREVGQLLGKHFKQSKERYDKLFESSHDALLALSLDTLEIEDANAKAEELTGLSRELLIGRWVGNFLPGVHGETLSAIENAEDQIHYLAGSRQTAVQVRSVVVASGERELLVLILRDMSDRIEAEDQFHLMAMVFETTTEGILITDPQTRILMVNRGFEKITGFSAHEAIGKTPALLHSGWQNDEFYQVMWREINQKGHWDGEIWNRRKNGDLFSEWISIYAVKDTQGVIKNFVGIVVDITEKKRTEEKISQLAFFDALTGLPNRTLFWDRFDHAIEKVKRDQSRLALMFLDLDNFKMINDTLGHQTGDQLLKGVAARVHGELRRSDTMARLGGDEFTLIVEEIEGTETVVGVAEKIIEVLKKPFIIDGKDVYTSFSIGICIFPDDANNAGQLLQAADTAMYRAKDLGKNGFQFYKAEMNREALEQMHLESGLRDAMSNNQLMVYYQPQVCLSSLKIIGAEALLRWKHPQEGFIGPSRFIPVAELSGLIGEIEDWMLREVSSQLGAWLKIMPDFKVSVNISNYQFGRDDFVQRTRNSIGYQQGDSCEAIELELTERIVMDDSRVRRKLDALKELGFLLSLDDFGTGYSSLGYLKNYRIDKLKIDKSFVDDLTKDRKSKDIILAIINLSASMNMSCVAEGVETEEQAEILRSLGCQFGQGYLWARPLPTDQFTAILTSGLSQEKRA